MADFDTTNLAGLSFLELYRTEEPLRFIMHRIGITIHNNPEIRSLTTAIIASNLLLKCIRTIAKVLRNTYKR